MYNDPSLSDSLEYFEIKNKGTADANIGGYQITDGVGFTFPANTLLMPDSMIVIAKSTNALVAVFGTMNVLQWSSGGLNNSGEAIEIQNSVGDVIDYVEYSDQNPWPIEGDGTGHSIEFCDFALDNNQGSNWRSNISFKSETAGDSLFGNPGKSCASGIGFENQIHLVESTQVFPNPTFGMLTIQSEAQNLQFQLTDLRGLTLRSGIIENSNYQIDIQELASGMYILFIIDEKENVKIGFKVLKQ
jgi:hypothetical protein